MFNMNLFWSRHFERHSRRWVQFPQNLTEIPHFENAITRQFLESFLISWHRLKEQYLWIILM